MSPRIRIYPHNNLFNLAKYQLEIIESKVEKNEEDALDLDCLACLVSCAFSVESLLNFVGHKKIKNWNERDKFEKKIKKICKNSSLTFDKSSEPYSTIWELKELRDQVAHAKPIEQSSGDEDHRNKNNLLDLPWKNRLTPSYVKKAFKTVRGFRNDLFEQNTISTGESLTSSVGNNKNHNK